MIQPSAKSQTNISEQKFSETNSKNIERTE